MKIKQIPEDFVVEEVLKLELEDGPWFYYEMKKKEWNTLDVVKEIKKRVKVRDVGFAGIKDRNAITTQYISVKKEIKFSLKDVGFTLLGRGKRRIYTGKLEGNKFTITIRDLDKELVLPKEVVNLFGPQRFSSQNVEVGKCLVQKKFKEACDLLDLEVSNNDCIGALRKIDMRKLKFYVHAYQSFLWNKLAVKSEEEILPILGFLTDGNDYEEIMEEENISKPDFIIRSMLEIGSEGGERPRVVKVEDAKTLSFEEDELNEGKMKQVVSFFLAKGSYATVVLDNMSEKAL